MQNSRIPNATQPTPPLTNSLLKNRSIPTLENQSFLKSYLPALKAVTKVLQTFAVYLSTKTPACPENEVTREPPPQRILLKRE